MRIIGWLGLLLVGCASSASKVDDVSTNSPKYPETRKDPIADTLHGVPVADPYRWLEDEKAPPVQAWMNAQDSFARAELGKLPGRDALMKRLKELYYMDA